MAQAVDDVSIYDYIIIGGGTSGAVAARRLAENHINFSVCLLEAGPSNHDVTVSHMPGSLHLMHKTPPDWCYTTVPQKGCNNRAIAITRGRLLGGCSAINATLVTRGTKADYDRIADMGNPGWSWKEMLPLFKASETFHPAEWHQADLNIHGTDGPLHISMNSLAPISEKILESFIDSGFDYKPDMFVQGDYEGVGHVGRTVYNGIRTTSADFIHKYEKTNLTVRTGVFVDRIILEKNNEKERPYKAVGVEAHDDINGQPIMIKARKEIILSAGAYNSPMVLMHSGIGWEKHLNEVGIDCKVNLRGVGENLQDHLLALTSYQVSDPNFTHDRFIYHHPDAIRLAIKEWEDTKTGVMASFSVGVLALTRIDKTIQDPAWEAAKVKQQSKNALNSDPTGQLPNQPHIEFISTQSYIGVADLLDADGLPYNPVNGEGIFTLTTFLCGPQARGTVRLSSKDPTSKPIIDHDYLNNDLDVAVLAEGCRMGHEIITKGRGTKDIIVGPWPKIVSHPNDMIGWKEHVRAFTNTGCHAAGTCKMAPISDPMGVVDSRLRPSKVSSDSDSGIQADDLVGDIQFTNVNFAYPSRPNVPILNDLSFSVQQGKTIALVGMSGCGKSTCMQLLQRFYDPINGSVMIGGHRVDEYHRGWLRQHIGVVSQEPILFQTTIAENIRLGRLEATQQEIEDAARIANAHDFIMTLPQKYDTLVGERGVQMSGSALDTESERIVQDALDRASEGRTTIVIAHRLSTIVHASKIIVIDKGTVIEEGNHQSLMELKGNYYGLVESQNLGMNTSDETELENEDENDLIANKKDNRTSSLGDEGRNAAETTFEERQDCQTQAQDDKNIKVHVLVFSLNPQKNISGEALTQRLREKIFRLLLRQEVAYFDKPENSTGALCTRLSTETSAVQGDRKALEEAGKIAIEAISNIRTVAQLVKETYFGDEYCKLLDVPLRVLTCLIFGAMAVGQAASLSPNYSKAIDASKHILALFERTPEIDNGAIDGDTFENFKGEINFVDLQFRYPNRPEVAVLKRFNLNIKPHQQVALVGASGCGKSTTIQLIERFYNPISGQLLVDHHDVSSLNLQWWRSKIGFVSQEPILFDASIRENIAYGDTSRYVPMDEIREAAKNANIHRFIESLPEQYETNVGAKGTQLSGGEKQRIAIARALIRNPSILLLDEATSALDTESERIVQEALDRASKGRTTIVIAHRLSTIQNSDVICVLHHGHIVEQGVHDDLLARKGFYYRLAQAKK
ncbi:unnamed protein product [Rotaria sp. Silwood1]|nr:unnamed protein product [Rotaria sp. Silwood1]